MFKGDNMKNGIFYANGEMFVKIGSEGCSSEDRSFFTHVEFWSDGRMTALDLIEVWPHETLLRMAQQFESGMSMSDILITEVNSQ
ncbi:MAG: hypothetical protein RL292_456 [Candidatus Parcubacteria bacterium]